MMQYPAQTYKNRLQEYTQKKSLPLPVYHTVNEGKDHLPQFRCTVTTYGTEYGSPPGFSHKKAAQNAAAKEAVEHLQMQGFKFKERKRPKCALAEYASMMSMPPPRYHFLKAFQATVEINGASYSGAPANNLREAIDKAALEAIWAIDPQYYVALSHAELNANNDSENVSEKLNVEDSLEMEEALKKETDVYQDKEHGSEEIEKKQQSSQEIDLIESITKRNRIEYESDEQMSERTKKHKGNRRSGTAWPSPECTVTYPDLWQ